MQPDRRHNEALSAIPKNPGHIRTILNTFPPTSTLISSTYSPTTIKFHLACIDAPETSQRPYGLQSRDALKTLLPIGSSVTLKVKAKDRYGRTVAEIYKGSRNLNQALVGRGQAFVYWQSILGCDRQRYGQLDRDARLMRLGVWSVAGGIQNLLGSGSAMWCTMRSFWRPLRFWPRMQRIYC